MKLTPKTATALVGALLAVTAAGCGDSYEPGVADQALSSKPPAALTADAKSTSASTSTAAPAAETDTSGDGAVLPISKDLDKKPSIPKPKGDAPSKLVVKDIVVGKGKEAKKGAKISVRYVGVSYEDGKQFDASWDRNMDFPFTLGQGDVIPGWDEGVVGMKVGGRRELVIPPDQAYGKQGQPPSIQPNATLVFVIDLVKA